MFDTDDVARDRNNAVSSALEGEREQSTHNNKSKNRVKDTDEGRLGVRVPAHNGVY